MARRSSKPTTRSSPRRSPRRSSRRTVQTPATTSKTAGKRTRNQTEPSRSKKGTRDIDVLSGNDEPAPKHFKSSGRRQDTRPASISAEDGDNDVIPPASKGRLRSAETSESGDESSDPSSGHVSRYESSSDEDLTKMKRDTIQSKMINERVSLKGNQSDSRHSRASSRVRTEVPDNDDGRLHSRTSSRLRTQDADDRRSDSRASSRPRTQVQDANDRRSDSRASSRPGTQVQDANDGRVNSRASSHLGTQVQDANDGRVNSRASSHLGTQVQDANDGRVNSRASSHLETQVQDANNGRIDSRAPSHLGTQVQDNDGRQSHSSTRHRAQVQDINDGESENDIVPKPKGKMITQRDRNRAREVPQWASDDKESDSDVPATTHRNWTESTTLIKGARGIFSVNAQPAQVKAVCKEAILNFEVELVFHSCFPLNADRVRMSKAAVIKAATDLRYDEILARVKADPMYCRNILSMPINRLSNIRQDVREAADQVLTEYIGGLAEGESVQERAKAWLQKKNYIWPGDATKPNGMRSQDPFLHPAVSKVIKAVWYEGTSRKPALASRFGNRYQGCDETEVPEAMVTVAATAIEAALVDCSNQSKAGKVPRSDFSAGTFSELHTWHCDLLGAIRIKNRHLHHRILTTIYNVVTDTFSSAVGFKVEDAMAQINFDAIENA